MRRSAKAVLSIPAAILIILSVLYIFRGTLFAPWLKSYLISYMESEYGLRVDVGRLEGNYLTTLNIHNFRTTGSDSPPSSVSFNIREVNLGFFLPDLLVSGEEFVGGMAAEIHEGNLELDLSAFPETSPEREAEPVLPVLPRISLHDCRIAVHDKKVDADFDRLSANLQGPGSGNPGRLRLRVGSLLFSYPGLRKQRFSMTATLVFTEDYLQVQRVTIDGTPVVESAEVRKGKGPGTVLALNADLMLFEGDMELTGRYAESGLELDMGGHNVQLKRLSAFFDPEITGFAGMVNGEGKMRTDMADPLKHLSGTLNFSVQGAKLGETEFEKLALRAEAFSGTLRIHELSGESEDKIFNLRANEVALPILARGDWLHLLHTADADFTLFSSDIPVFLNAAGFKTAAGKIPAHSLSLQGDLQEKRVSVTAELRAESAKVKVTEASLTLPRENQPISQSRIAAHLQADIPEPARIFAILGLPELGGEGITFDLDLKGTADAPRGDLSLTADKLRYKDHPLGHLTAYAKADSDLVLLDSLTLGHGENRVKAKGVLDLRPFRLRDSRLEFNLPELSDYALLVPWLDLRGRAEGTVTAEGPLRKPKVRLGMDLKDALVNKVPIADAHLELVNRGRITTLSQARANIAGNEVEISAQVRVGPAYQEIMAKINSLALTDPSGGDLVLQRPVSISYGIDGLEVDDFMMIGTIGRLEADGRLSRETESRLNLRLSGFGSGDWLSLRLGDRLKFEELDADITLSGRLSSPVISLEGKFKELSSSLFPFPFNGEYSLGYSSAGIDIHSFSLRSENDMVVTLSGKLPLDPLVKDVFLPGELTLSGLVELPRLGVLKFFLPPDLTLTGTARGDIHLTGSWRNPEGRLQLNVLNIDYRHSSIPDVPGPFDITADLVIDGRELTLRNMQLDSSVGGFHVSGKWENGPVPEQILHGRLPKWEGYLSGRGSLVLTELDWLASILDFLRRTNGRLEADLRLEGPVNNPDIRGEFRLRDGEVRTTFDFPSIQGLDAQADFEKGRILLHQMEGGLGSAPFNLRGQILREDGEDPVFDLKLDGTNLLFFRNEWMKVRADTILMLEGPFSRPELSGRMVITDAYYRKRFKFLDILRGNGKPVTHEGLRLFSFREPPLREMVFQVDITSEDPLEINNNIIRTSIRPDLRLTGTGELPVLVGRIYVDPGKITLPTATLNIKSGLIQFQRDNPNNPGLNIMADTRMRGYDLEMIIEGTYREPIITLSSVPPLPREDLLLLLLTGREPSPGQEAELARSAGTGIALYFGKDLLGRIFDGESEESILERLQLEIGRSITRKGEETLEAQFRLGRDILISDNVYYLTAEKDIYDDYNVGLKIVFKFK